MKDHNATGMGGSARFRAVLILAAVLAILFWRSLLADYVHFSNDGPLGQQNTASAHLPEAFHGVWFDTYDVGSGGDAWTANISALFRWVAGPVGYAKFLAPFALFILGLGAWSFFRQLKLSPLAALLGALAAALNSTFLGTACWGIAQHEIAVGMDYFALALVMSSTAETPFLVRSARLALAGLCVGMNVMEGADVGAIFSLFVAAFVAFTALIQTPGGIPARIIQATWQLAVVAIFAGFIACQTVTSLVGTQITGIAGSSQDSETKANRWDWATQWSLPKAETLSLVVPGLFGYKLDTPAHMAPEFSAFYSAGSYWGRMGRDPAWERYYANGRQGSPPRGSVRQTSGTDYCGILVVLVAIWAAAQAWRKRDSAFSAIQRRYIWFWTGIAVLCVLFAWGRFSIFYAFLYKLPYFSTIRSPTKFLIVFSWSLVVLFAYGVDGFSRQYLTAARHGIAVLPASANFRKKLKIWWATASNFDRRWTQGCVVAVLLSLVAWLVYSGGRESLRRYLESVGFPNNPEANLADSVAGFSIRQAGWFVVLFTLAAGLVWLVISGRLTGLPARQAGWLLGLFLVADLGRADLPYITHWNYKQKYDIDTQNPGASTSPILNFLRNKYYEHRVTQLPFGIPEAAGQLWFGQLYQIEWLQHQFPYYNIQTLDVSQRSRLPADVAAFDHAVYFRGTMDTASMLPREWQLTNTRYVIGAANYLDPLNSLDRRANRFRLVDRFNIVPKPGISQPTQLEEITASPDPDGKFALYEFTGALPRAKLYSTWQAITNDETTLQTLGSPEFDPLQTVLVAAPPPGAAMTATNENAGHVEFTSYAPTKITFSATTPTPAILLLNDKYDPHWAVTVDDRPQPLLRCNFIMRGVFLGPGTHTVVFKYYLPNKLLPVTIAAYGAALLLAGFLAVAGRTTPGQCV